jgi:SAM-dependent methyltransferase
MGSLTRANMVGRVGEAWRPPSFSSRRDRLGRALAWLRRQLDLQAGSIWRDLSALLPDCEGDVLDVGCGAQPYRSLLATRARYAAIDRADARERFGYDVPDTCYYEGDHWPVPDAAFDLVLATETLEHVPDPALFLGEARRSLRPGGRLVLTVPFAARWHYIPHDYWRFTPSGLARLLEAQRFCDVAVYARGNAVTVACYKVQALILPLLLAPGSRATATVARRILGFALTPAAIVLAVVGGLSLFGHGGDDCLGYTAVARRPPEEAS